MKNAISFLFAAILFAASANAQSTVDSIEAKYKLLPMPEALTVEKTFPVLGSYQLSGATSGAVTITLDSSNKGIVWISGLPEGRMKAYLKQSPATYRILAQKTDLGTLVPEGAMVYMPETNTLNIELGKPYDEAAPTSVFPATAVTATVDAGMNGTANTTFSDATLNNTSKVIVKTKSGNTKSKTKTHLVYYTGTKDMTANTSASAPVQQ
jgi:hypothetical protein